jgi:putative DNA primase/helicase
MELLRGAGDELRGELLALGVEIDPSAKTLLANYLQAKPPKRRMRCAQQVGWCDDSFVLPDAVIGLKASGVIFQSGERGHDEHTKGGTLAGWQADIAARAIGNPMMVMGIAASFAGPILKPCNAESGGPHFVGDSSIGKTTITNAGCSTWGGPNFRRSWRATANGMEGAAALFNDGLLALDDISEADPKEVGAIVYSLGNGTGKQRAGRSGNARAVTRWRCVVLSNGERTIATTMAEGGHRAKAGQSVRMLDIPAARRFGVLDDLHDFPNGAAFSDAIKKAAATHYGHAGRAFLEKLTRDGRDFCALLERIKGLAEFSAEGSEGQDKRGAARFALLALAGELATEYGITGWPEGEAIRAAAEGFRLWRSLRGHGNDERRQILDRVSGFIERHGDGRFSDAGNNSETPIRDRAGWWRNTPEGREYLFTADGMREALKGFDFARALDALQESGALPIPGADGKRAKFYRISGRGVKLYPVQADKLGGDHHGA